MTPLELQQNLKKFTKQGLENQVKEIILSDNKAVFRKQDEMERGQNPDGSTIGTYSNSPMGREYAIFKQQINPMAGGTVDLILTGSTRDKMRIESLGNSKFTLNSSDNKWLGLKAKYGAQISGINTRYWNSLQKDYYAPELFNKIRKIIGR